MRFFYPTEYKVLFKLSIPVIIGQVGLTLQNLADNVMVGRHSTSELAAFAGWQMIFVMGIFLSFAAYLLRHHIAILFTDEPAVSAIVATHILPLILYQLGDGIQVTFVNALRGLGDVKRLVLYAGIAYLVISLPLSYLLGITLGWGAFGIWMAFPFGLTTAAILYLRRFLWVTGRRVRF